ncbi:zinc/iron permease [Planoprotostelium fungivorum]|uniref:Zinc transporter ZIP11 n=1 Tax=Planoprotostelium fungivorum TaxID=1890364 RepID=A0A2P6NY97_9EUKA|nr:zinc/iron permease [Planoprotostelium fungivorum]
MDLPPIVQALIGTGFTYGMTVLGAGIVFITKSISKKAMDFFYGFTAGIMIATSCFGSGVHKFPGSQYQLASSLEQELMGTLILRELKTNKKKSKGTSDAELEEELEEREVVWGAEKARSCFDRITKLMWGNEQASTTKLRRAMLLVLAITLHNFPEGLAVGVAFGSIQYADDKEKAFHNALTLAFAVGVQNIPEGLSISMPLRREGEEGSEIPLTQVGMSQGRAFFHGQLSGLVEPLGGLIGALAVSYVRPLLPLSLSFAAGAMLFVVMEELIPESQRGHKNWATLGTLLGFLVMMILENTLG